MMCDRAFNRILEDRKEEGVSEVALMYLLKIIDEFIV